MVVLLGHVQCTLYKNYLFLYHQVAQELFCEERPVIKKEMRAKIFEIHCRQWTKAKVSVSLSGVFRPWDQDRPDMVTRLACSKLKAIPLFQGASS